MNSIKTAYLDPVVGLNLGAVKWSMFLSIFTALAILLPYTCHQFGLAGMVFLPMHFAVLIAAIVIGFRGGVLVALISPALSYAISGMPPVTSLLPMTIELATYAIVINLMVRKIRTPMILSLIVAMLLGRLISITLVSMILQNTPLATQFHNLFVTAMPGILIQLAFVPLVSSKIIGFLRNK